MSRSRSDFIRHMVALRAPLETVKVVEQKVAEKKVVVKVAPKPKPDPRYYAPPVWNIRPGAEAHLLIKSRGVG